MDFLNSAIGIAGVGLLLVAFFLNIFKILSQETKTYAIMNIIGGALACYYSWVSGTIPFVVLEGVWAIASVAGLARTVRAKRM
ncbi:MAG: hypothetical protein PHH26_08945 [Candidatus Thermoplasmatota archaeon]|nr:hypothetical protein [Candidatus Thermoplasmatota archaeon]